MIGFSGGTQGRDLTDLPQDCIVPFEWRVLRKARRAVGPILIPLSALYGKGMWLRARLYRTARLTVHRLPCPVISVGNLTMGGTGKTPTVIFLARFLRDAGRRPAVISRGYRGHAGGRSNVVSDGHKLLMGCREAGDEPVLLAKSLAGTPVLTGRNRVDPGREAVERFGSDVILLDDGFQHLSLAREMDIVLIDSRSGLGNGRVLPAGPLREPPDALARADAVLLTKWDGHGGPCPGESVVGLWNPTAPVFHARYRARALVDAAGNQTSVQALKGTKVSVVAGLADPDYFLSTLCSLGAQVVEARLFADHYPYPERIITRIRGMARKADCIITTEKDMIKLAGRVAGLLALVVEQEVIEHDAFQHLVWERIHSHG